MHKKKQAAMSIEIDVFGEVEFRMEQSSGSVGKLALLGSLKLAEQFIIESIAQDNAMTGPFPEMADRQSGTVRPNKQKVGKTKAEEIYMKALQFIGNRLRAVKNSDEKAEFIINQDFIHYLQNPNE